MHLFFCASEYVLTTPDTTPDPTLRTQPTKHDPIYTCQHCGPARTRYTHAITVDRRGPDIHIPSLWTGEDPIYTFQHCGPARTRYTHSITVDRHRCRITTGSSIQVHVHMYPHFVHALYVLYTHFWLLALRVVLE
jgi:hypothetical protein